MADACEMRKREEKGKEVEIWILQEGGEKMSDRPLNKFVVGEQRKLDALSTQFSR